MGRPVGCVGTWRKKDLNQLPPSPARFSNSTLSTIKKLPRRSLSWSSGLKVSYGHSRSLSVRVRELSEGSGFPLSDKVKKEGAVKKVLAWCTSEWFS